MAKAKKERSDKKSEQKEIVEEVIEEVKEEVIEESFEEAQIRYSVQAVTSATSLKEQELAKKQALIVLNNNVKKDPTLLKVFLDAVKESKSDLFGLNYGAIDEITNGSDETIRAWNALIVIINLLKSGGKLPFDKHGVKSQFSGKFEELGKQLSKTIP